MYQLRIVEQVVSRMLKIPPKPILFTLKAIIYQSIVLVLMLFDYKLFSCPVYLYKTGDLVELSGKRKYLKLFTFSKKTNQWHSKKIQLDAVIEDKLDFSTRDDAWGEQEISNLDRIIFDPQDLEDAGSVRKLPCQNKPKVVYKVIDYLNPKKIGYITACKDNLKIKQEDAFAKFHPKKHLITSNKYEYKFNQKNYLLFDDVSVLVEGNKKIRKASISELMIHANINNIFDLNFDSTNILSELKEFLHGPVALNMGVSFMLRALMFNIDLSLSTYSSFHKNTAHIPMILHLPVDGTSFFNYNSGLMYHWITSSTKAENNTKILMPLFDQNTKNLFKETKNLNKIVSKYCNPSLSCIFSYISAGAPTFIIQLDIQKKLVEKGFFPIYIDNLEFFNKEFNWALEDWGTKEINIRKGIYFNISGLKSGDHAWDLWMGLGGEKASSLTCPHPIYLNLIKM